jgi:hypothetical protein
MDNLTLYVYYKVPIVQSASCLLAVKQLHQVIALRYPEIAMQQQKRPYPDAAHQETWMETYAGMTQIQIEKLIADLSELAVGCGLPNERKYEVFINL